MAKKSVFHRIMEKRLKYLLEDESVSKMSIQGYGTVRENVLDLLDLCEDFGYEEELLSFTEKNPDATDMELWKYYSSVSPGLEIVPNEEWNEEEDEEEEEEEEEEWDEEKNRERKKVERELWKLLRPYIGESPVEEFSVTEDNVEDLIGYAFYCGVEEKLLAEVKANPKGDFWSFPRLIPLFNRDEEQDGEEDKEGEEWSETELALWSWLWPFVIRNPTEKPTVSIDDVEDLIVFASSAGIEKRLLDEVKANPKGNFWDFLRLFFV